MTVLVLGLGTAAATVVFSVVDAVVLRPLPYEAPDRLVTMWDTNLERELLHDPISPVNFMDYRALPVFADAAAWWRPGVNLTDPGLDPVRVNTIEVSANLFEVLGVRPRIGAGFPSGGPFFHQSELIAVISDRLWRSRYSSDASLLGRQLLFNGTPYTIVGIMPPKFHYPDDVDVWQRVQWDYHQHSRAAHFMEAVARLAGDASFEQAQSAVDTLALTLQNDFPSTNKGWATRLVPLLDEQLGYYRAALMVVFGAVGLLVAIGALNIASLLLTRALAREREMAVRVAIGASRRQLVAQLLAESFVLSAAGALVGVALAAAALPVVLRLVPVQIPRLDEAALDLRALALSLGVAAATTTVFGLLPAVTILRGRTRGPAPTERGSSRRARRVYSILVAGEIALAAALLVSSALLVRTVGRMTNTPTGVDADSVLTTTVQLATPRGSFSDWQIVGDTYARLLVAIRQQPGVIAAGAANFLPLEVGWRLPFGIDGQPAPAVPEDAPRAQMHSVSDGYFEAMGAKLVSGRLFTSLDTATSTPVAIVNETFARVCLASGPALRRVLVSQASNVGPLGRSLAHVKGSESIRYEIVGVVGDIRNGPFGQSIEPAIYFTTQQFPFREMVLAVRARDARAALGAVGAGLRTAAPGVPMAKVQTWSERFGARTAQPRLLMAILMFFGVLAALLAAVGVYGLFSWSVALRTRELAIRLTLGAQPLSVGWSVLAQGLALAAIGLLAGFVLIRLAEGALAQVLFEVTPGDARSNAAASALLAGAALVACLPAAVRAMRIDPSVGLRAE